MNEMVDNLETMYDNVDKIINYVNLKHSDEEINTAIIWIE